MSSPISVRAVTSTSDIQEFLGLPEPTYRGDPNWVPPIWSEWAALINPVRNPFFQHGQAELFLARDPAGVPSVGSRLAAVGNTATHNHASGIYAFLVS